MWNLLAADVPGSESSQPLIIALISALSGIVVAAFGSLVALAKREGSTPASHNTDDDRANPRGGNERTAVLEQRADDTDDRDEVQDLKIEAILRFLDRKFDGWRP